MSETTLRDIATENVACVDCATPLLDVALLMRDHNLSCLPVLEQGVPVGMVTEHDFSDLAASLLTGGRPPPLREIMSGSVVSIACTASAQQAFQLMIEHRIRRLLVLDELGHCCGLVTQSDLLRAHVDEVERQKAALEQRVAERTRELQMLNARLAEMTLRDPMLQIGNRRAMDLALQDLQESAPAGFAVAVVDVDHFKIYNDSYGHQRGDEVLIAIVDCVVAAVGSSGSVYRYGGEEFLVLLPDADEAAAESIAGNVRCAVAELAIDNARAPLGTVTVSVGLAMGTGCEPTTVDVVKRADAALYRAKSSGRNCVEGEVQQWLRAA